MGSTSAERVYMDMDMDMVYMDMVYMDMVDMVYIDMGSTRVDACTRALVDVSSCKGSEARPDRRPSAAARKVILLPDGR